MSNVLTQDRKEKMAQSVEGIMSEPLTETLEDVVEETGKEQSVASFGDGTVQLLLLVDLKSALNYLRETRSEAREMGEMSEMSETIDIDTSTSTQQKSGGSKGRGTLTRLFLVGAVVGLGYVLRRRMGSVDEVVTEASDRAQSVAERTSERTSEFAEQTTAVTDEAANTVEESSEQVADQIESGGEAAADQIESTGETAADEVDSSGDATAERVEEVSEEMEERADEDADDEEYE